MKRFLKSQLFAFILGAVIFSSFTAYAAIAIYAYNINYESSDETWNVNNVEEALDDLYSKARTCSFGEWNNGDITIYTAADDFIYYYEDDMKIPVCASDLDGVANNCNVPTGTITIYSSVAKNPSNLAEFYSKEVTVDNSTSELYLMPTNGDYMLYWYGYKGNIELISVANGWSGYGSSSGFKDATFNKDYIDIARKSDGYFYGVGAKNPINVVNNQSKMYTIYYGVSGSSSNMNPTGAKTNKIWSGGTRALNYSTGSSNNSMLLANSSAILTSEAVPQIGCSSGSVSAYRVYASWVEY